MSHPQRSASGAVFRPEIEGLRAVAACLVAIFHIYLGRVSGGVDVFFVVSGFLITTGLITEIERKGSPALVRFWGRLIKRLLPAALLVLLAVVIASILFLPESRWKTTIQEVAASAAYVENWVLAFNSVDYLAMDGPVSPVQHFWALSTQGQFYLVWPLLFAGVAILARRSGIAFRSAAATMLGLLFFGSLAYSVWLTHTNQPFAYFSTFARVWEFCIGGLLALFIARIQLPARLRVLAGWIGLLAIVSCGLILQVSTVFPGYAALWPTLAASLVILAGTTGSAIGVDRILGSRPMVYLGSISYGIYLWHFPILIFHRMYVAPQPVSLVAGLCIMAASVVLAVLTHRFIETPVKRADIGSAAPWRAYAFGALCATPLVIGLAAWSALFFQARAEEQKIVAIGNSNYPGARALEKNFRYQGASHVEVYPGPYSFMTDREYPTGEGCGQPYTDVVPQDCTITGKRGMPTIAVVGGSHSAQWLPALMDIALKEKWRIVTYTKSNCPFHLADGKLHDREWHACSEWNRHVLGRVIRLKPDAVFMTSTRYDSGKEIVPQSYLEAWRALGKAGIDVVAVRDNPEASKETSACIEMHGKDAPACARPRKQTIAAISPVALLKHPPANVRFIDLLDYFCTPTNCPPVVGNVLLYRDGSHITATYIRSLGPMLHEEILETGVF